MHVCECVCVCKKKTPSLRTIFDVIIFDIIQINHGYAASDGVNVDVLCERTQSTGDAFTKYHIDKNCGFRLTELTFIFQLFVHGKCSCKSGHSFSGYILFCLGFSTKNTVLV